MFCHKYNNKADIIKGIQIDKPKIFISWDITEQEFLNLFKDHNVRCVVEKMYFVKDITFFGGSNCNMGVDFTKGRCCNIGFSREYYGTGTEKEIYTRSYNSFQNAFEDVFGKPTKRSRDEIGFDNCEWEIGGKIKIYHYIMSRFGLEEHLYVEHM